MRIGGMIDRFIIFIQLADVVDLMHDGPVDLWTNNVYSAM